MWCLYLCGMENCQQILYALMGNRIDASEALECLAKIGYCPNLMNDDYCRWAVSFDGLQPMPNDEPSDMNISVFVAKDMWKGSVRDAVIDALMR